MVMAAWGVDAKSFRVWASDGNPLRLPGRRGGASVQIGGFWSSRVAWFCSEIVKSCVRFFGWPIEFCELYFWDFLSILANFLVRGRVRGAAGRVRGVFASFGALLAECAA